VSEAEYEAMSASERWDYARGFDQKQLRRLRVRALPRSPVLIPMLSPGASEAGSILLTGMPLARIAERDSFQTRLN
jgi:hypothetical protein